ncbi:hypothetical protein Rsub_00082 [Raphidocelis subcapitata]|uniref:Uncharacterized protein n=1 Tax=Raphidocelis subcapitata TaxID=307507 RepID=A0A2V0NJI0_9CHLO|nr:hypothetical protein Rsub_00082 [Raphidocelis subcapitata]|eukprot:GBF87371.1 hypothetical protein Rsub_00082 [Raphidocelis subcapitata]
MPRARALALFALVLLAIGPNLSEARRALQQAEQAGSTGRSEPRPVAASAAEAPAEKQDEQPASDLEKILGAVGGVIGSVLGAILPPPPNGSTSAAAVDPRAVAPAAEAAGQEPETVVITNDPQPDRDGLGINGPAPAARAGGGPGEPPVTPLTEAINSTLNGLGNAVKT